MATERLLVRLPDGRDIEVRTAGPADGLPLVVHEGTPMGLVLNNRLASAGAMVIENRMAPRRANATVQAIGLKRRPSTRCNVKMGRYAVMMIAIA